MTIWSHFSCQQNDEQAQGCCTISQAPFHIELATALDPARDLQRIHSLIVTHMAKLQIFTRCDPSSPYTSPGTCSIFLGDDFPASQRTLQALEEVSDHLEQIHRKYKTILARELRIGSQQAPIGEFYNFPSLIFHFFSTVLLYDSCFSWWFLHCLTKFLHVLYAQHIKFLPYL